MLCVSVGASAIDYFYADGASGKTDFYPFSNFQRIEFNRADGLLLNVQLKDKSDILTDNRVVVFATPKYLVKFLNEDGTLLQESEFELGSTPVYEGDEPTKDDTEQYTYSFKGWNPEITPVAGEAVYTAEYTPALRKYAIKYVNYNGTELQNSDVEYGAMPAYEGETPVKPADAQYTYTFSGWSPVEAPVTGVQTYTAQFSTTVNKYTITFVNDDSEETPLYINDFEYNSVPEYGGPAPVKEATDKYEYTFSHWTPAITNVTADATYKAVYTSSVRKYVIKFVNYDGTDLFSKEYEYGATPAYEGATPTKAATAEFTYTFDNWNPEIGTVTGTQTYTAKFTETKNKYLITYKNYDGTELQNSDVEYGAMPAYEEETPVKPADAQYTYTFSGWSPEEAPVTVAQTYTAQFTSTVIKYTVKFLNEDGTLLQEESLDYGVTPTYKGATPTKTATAQYTYTFDTWSPAITTVTGDAEYTATYSSTVNDYMVRFVNYDGEELQSGYVPYGSTPAYTGATPVKPSTEEFTYTFDGWNPEIDAITGTTTYTAQFIETRNEYEIRFLNYDGTELQNYPVAYGATPVYDGTTPTKPATAQYTYTFSGWEPALAKVTKAQDYTATYSSTVNKYVIKFVNYDGTELQSTEVEYGEIPEYTGATPEKPATDEFTYTFSGWEPELVAVTESTIYSAQFSSIVNSYEIEVNVSADGGGTVTGGGTYLYGTEVTITATPDKGYAFENWNNGNDAKSFTITVTGDNDYTAFFHTQNADNTPECNDVASLSKSDWMLMLNVKDLHTQGYVFSESNVSWYKIVGERDNLSHPSYMRDDQYVGTGYFYTMDKSLHGTGDYYGLVNLPEQKNEVGCLGIMRTETFNYAYQGSLRTALVPTIVAPGEELKLVELPDGEDVEILVYDQVGKLYYQFKTGGVIEQSFNAPYNHGNYMVLVKSKDGEKTFKYIVK